ncbi:MAG: ABC transporter permease [Acidobacteria bacterium]|nr:ABC transporter permease [Acidobacteriota bacterium]
MKTLWQDVRFGLRMLRKNLGFSAVVVVTLALAIGANTTVFTLVKGTLLGELPFEKAEQIVTVWSNNLSKKQERLGMSFPDFVDFQTQAKSFQGLSFFPFYRMTISDPGRPAEQQEGARVSWNAFSLIGVKPILGRDFLPADDIPGAPSVAIISHALWQSRYNGDPNIVGKTIRINEDPKIIVGVMGPGMKFPYNQAMWFPIRLNQNIRNNRELRGQPVFARLADGVSLEQAKSEVSLLAKNLEKQYPDKNKGIGAFVETYNSTFSGGTIRLVLLSLFGAVGFVLLIACANIANLLLSRSLTRAKEISIRAALGASRGRVIQQLLVESLLMGAMGSVLGLLISIWGVRLFLTQIPAEWSMPYWMNFSPDFRVFGFLTAICVGTSVLFGLIPALHSSKVDLNSTLKEGGRGNTGGRTRFLSRALVVTEVSLALVLLVGAGLMIRSFLKQYSMSAGLERKDVLTMAINLLGAKYNSAPNSAAEVTNFYNRLETELKTVPEAETVALASSLPLSWTFEWPHELEGHPVADPKQAPPISAVVITANYFDVLGISLLRGRRFTEQDGQPGQTTAIINQRFANKYWAGENPIGKRLRMWTTPDPQATGPPPEPAWLTVVGVVPDVRQKFPSQQPEIGPVVYIPYREAPPQRYIVVLARSRVEVAHALIKPIRDMVGRANPDITVTDVLTLPEYFARSRFDTRLFGSLFLIFAAIGVILAAVGIYAVMAYSVSQRTQEIGIRMALGAGEHRILKLILGQGLALAVIGVGIGIAGSYAITRVMARLLIGVTPTDPITFVAVALFLTLIAVFACYVPARRAARVDPTLALRAE